MKDLAVTWPKGSPLSVYLERLEYAVAYGLEINFRVPSKPRVTPERCYMVHDGKLRGYNLIRSIEYRGPREVEKAGGGFWPEGWYIVRAPEWHPILPVPMRGFQGYRYIDRVG